MIRETKESTNQFFPQDSKQAKYSQNVILKSMHKQTRVKWIVALLHELSKEALLPQKRER